MDLGTTTKREPDRAVSLLLASYQQALGHDLPNKLVALQGMARLLVQELGSRLDDESQDLLDRLATLSRQLHEQVGALSEVGRACRQTGAVSLVPLNEVWAEVKAEIQWLSANRCLHFEQSRSLPSLTMPREAVRRVLLELARDALRRCPVENPLTLRLRGDVGSSSLEFEDDGPPPTRPATAFDPRTDSPAGPAAGLGLFLARLLVLGWGGELTLTVPVGGGCRFCLELCDSSATMEGRK